MSSLSPSRIRMTLAVAALILAPSAAAPFPQHHTSRGPSIGPTTGPSVGPTTGPSIGITTGPSIGATVGPSVGESVGPSIGASVGPSIGSPSAERAARQARHHRGSHPADRDVGRSFAFVGVPVVAYPSPFLAPLDTSYVPPAPPLVYAEPPAYAAAPAPVVNAPPAAYAPATSGPPAPPSPTAAPSRPSVIEFPEGRYELRGDGVTAPYTWVWIPNPPAAPPALARPVPGDRPRDRRTRVYRWTDDDGVLHFTDRRDAVPERYRGVSTSQ